MRIILASSSKQRQDIFNMIGLKYDVITSNEPEESNKTSPNKPKIIYFSWLLLLTLFLVSTLLYLWIVFSTSS